MTAHSHSNFKTWKNSFYPFDAEIKSLRAKLPASYLKGSLCDVFISRSALKRFINYWMHEMQNVMQTAVHTAVPPQPEHNGSDVEMANEKLKAYV